MAPLVLVAYLTTRWHHLQQLHSWPPDGATCVSHCGYCSIKHKEEEEGGRKLVWYQINPPPQHIWYFSNWNDLARRWRWGWLVRGAGGPWTGCSCKSLLKSSWLLNLSSPRRNLNRLLLQISPEELIALQPVLSHMALLVIPVQMCSFDFKTFLII